jgi:tubulin polyglutamylase TTLL6/13
MLAEGRAIFNLTAQLLPSLNDTNHKDVLLVWWDDLRPQEEKCLGNLRNGQIVNRIPNMNLLCRKTPLARLLQRMQVRCPGYTFFPQSFILPTYCDSFLAARNSPDSAEKSYIFKPDGGALGVGIKILDPGDEYEPSEYLCVVQEYIESALYNGFKFDFRIYVLVGSVCPVLQIYIYPEGLCRVCSEPASKHTQFARVTNTALNKRKPGVVIQNITKLISELLPIVCAGIRNHTEVWKDIERLIVMTIISRMPYLKDGILALKRTTQHFECFQLLGFDVMLDQHCVPQLLEVNYRPSLAHDTPAGGALKSEMMIDTLWLMVASRIQAGSPPLPKEFMASVAAWRTFFQQHQRPDLETGLKCLQ